MNGLGRQGQVKVDIRLTSLKPMVVSGMIKAIDYFKTASGEELIKKGFKKAGLLRCFEPEFRAAAIAWVKAQGPQALNPEYVPAEAPPSSMAHTDAEMALVTLDEELMDLI